VVPLPADRAVATEISNETQCDRECPVRDAEILDSPPEQGARLRLLFAGWVLACVATLGSLFFSEVMGIAPCVLCWYQRVFMYPLVVVLGVGLFASDNAVIRYAMPLATLGWVVAGYHFLVYTGYIPESLQPCSQGVSCAEINLRLFGFITIPLLSLATFSAIVALLVGARTRTEK